MFEDVITLGSGHSIMIGHRPSILGLEDFSDKFYKSSKVNETSNSFGLFGSDINYNTYYPDVKKEDLTPTDEEFIEPIFRMLSECIVARNWSPTDFSKNGVLKESMSLLLGQTVNCDHETSIGNAIGSVKSVSWQDSYSDSVNGKKLFIPAGINASLKIDAKANPRIARGILMDPPSVHSNSVTVKFAWEKSHPKLSDDEFRYKIGTFDDKGQLIRKIASNIIGYYETSLVSHGADPFAQKVGKDGKIINPVHANNSNNSFSDKPTRNLYFFNDYKNLANEEVLHNTMVFINENKIDPKDHGNNNSNNNNMNEELKAFLHSLFGEGLISLGNGVEPTMELAVSSIKGLVLANQSLSNDLGRANTEKGNLTSEVTTLKETIENNKFLLSIGTQHLSDVRKEVTDNYKKLMGTDMTNESMVTLIASADITTLATLGNTYKVQLEEKFPLSCSECGSKNVNRASSVDSGDKSKSGDDTSTSSNTADVIKRLRENKLK